VTGLAKKGWDLVVDQAALCEAVKFATRKGAYARAGRRLDKSVQLVATADGIMVGSAFFDANVPGIGVWEAPIRVDGPTLAYLAPKLTGPVVRMQFSKDTLLLNTTRIGATLL